MQQQQQLSNLERERKLFSTCLALAPTERDAYLARECESEPDLRDRVRRLLEAHSRALSTHSAAGSVFPVIEDIPDLVGRYQLLRVIGEGGMGTVYEAEQQEPVRRRVALKIIQLAKSGGPGSAAVIARFAAEQQALALMDHPNVAKVFDAGETLLGFPYFVMELVDGEPLTGYCNRANLGIRERLRIFLQLCRAVEHAHQKGVIHRDLKPANVLVTGSAGEALVKVIDFGIAKAAASPEAPSADLAAATATRGPIGTPAYMSPEQAGAAPGGVDTRSDVYSLGVILYELLTGRLPAEPGTLGYAEFLHRLAAGNLSIAPPSRHAPPPLDADLDWIALRALETDRARRYASAAALAEDVERFLSHRAVTARPPTVSYRAGRFIRRHRIQTAAAAVALAALLAGSIAAYVGYLRATRAEAAAQQEAAAARETADFLVSAFKVSDPGQSQGRTVTARELLDNASQRIDTELASQPAVRQRMFTVLSRAHYSLGLYQQGAALSEKALAALPSPGNESLEDAGALMAHASANARLDRFDQAREGAARALAIRTRLAGASHPAVAEALQLLGLIEVQADRFTQAADLLNRAIAIRKQANGPLHVETGRALRGLGHVYLQTRQPGDTKRALSLFEQTLPIFEARLGESHPEYADLLDSIGLCQPTPQQSLEWMNRAFTIRRRVLGPDHVTLAFSHHNLGRTLARTGKLQEARGHLLEALRIREARLGPDSLLAAAVLQTLFPVEQNLGNTMKAYGYAERVARISLALNGPDNMQTQMARSNLGLMLVCLRRFDEALPHLREGFRGRVYFNWKDTEFDPVRRNPKYLALVAEMDRLKAERPSEN